MTEANEFDSAGFAARLSRRGIPDATQCFASRRLLKVIRKQPCRLANSSNKRGIFLSKELQELYAATFDLDPHCSLEVGWHLFGENYERGEFLVKMRVELRRLGVGESTELPDHLTHALAALGRMEPQEAAEFATACLFPALDKMCAATAGASRIPSRMSCSLSRACSSTGIHGPSR